MTPAVSNEAAHQVNKYDGSAADTVTMQRTNDNRAANTSG